MFDDIKVALAILDKAGRGEITFRDRGVTLLVWDNVGDQLLRNQTIVPWDQFLFANFNILKVAAEETAQAFKRAKVYGP